MFMFMRHLKRITMYTNHDTHFGRFAFGSFQYIYIFLNKVNIIIIDSPVLFIFYCSSSYCSPYCSICRMEAWTKPQKDTVEKRKKSRIHASRFLTFSILSCHFLTFFFVYLFFFFTLYFFLTLIIMSF